MSDIIERLRHKEPIMADTKQAREFARSLISHPVAFGTIEHTERAGELLAELLAERDALAAKLAQAREALRGLLRRVDDGADYGPDHAVSIARAALAQEHAPAPKEPAPAAPTVKDCLTGAAPSASAPAEPVALYSGEEIEHCVACLYDDAQSLRDLLANDEDERAANMDLAANMLTSLLQAHAAAIAAARREVRERCARKAESCSPSDGPHAIAAAIRSLGDE